MTFALWWRQHKVIDQLDRRQPSLFGAALGIATLKGRRWQPTSGF